MPISINWVDESKQILIIQFKKAWSLEEFHLMIQNANKLADGISHSYVTIMDYTETITAPHSILSARSQSSKQIPSHLVGVINVNSGMLINIFMKAFAPFHPKHVRFEFANTIYNAQDIAESILTNTNKVE